MKLSELILAVGDENVAFQNLDRSAHSIDKTKSGTKITFYTDAVQAEEWLGNGQTKKLGLVVWLPRDRVYEAVAAQGIEAGTAETRSGSVHESPALSAERKLHQETY